MKNDKLGVYYCYFTGVGEGEVGEVNYYIWLPPPPPPSKNPVGYKDIKKEEEKNLCSVAHICTELDETAVALEVMRVPRGVHGSHTILK